MKTTANKEIKEIIKQYVMIENHIRCGRGSFLLEKRSWSLGASYAKLTGGEIQNDPFYKEQVELYDNVYKTCLN